MKYLALIIALVGCTIPDNVSRETPTYITVIEAPDQVPATVLSKKDFYHVTAHAVEVWPGDTRTVYANCSHEHDALIAGSCSIPAAAVPYEVSNVVEFAGYECSTTNTTNDSIYLGLAITCLRLK